MAEVSVLHFDFGTCKGRLSFVTIFDTSPAFFSLRCFRANFLAEFCFVQKLLILKFDPLSLDFAIIKHSYRQN